jgi:ABC-type nitrate/sulfonate/bicarbonate transport system ATPase subunit
MHITVENVSFAYSPPATVLKGISFQVPHNSVVGILGSSGSGKSTLLRIMLGLLPSSPTQSLEGAVTLDCKQTMADLRRKGKVALMFQEPSLLANLTVEQNVALPLKMLRRRDGITNGDVNQLITDVGLSKFRHFLPKHLSGGMQTRTALARTFSARPELLLLDEPFTGLDYGWRLDLYSQLVRLIAGCQSTAVIVSHDIDEILLLADTVLLLSKDGRLISTKSVTHKKPSAFQPEHIANFLDAMRDEVVSLQNELIREQSETDI